MPPDDPVPQDAPERPAGKARTPETSAEEVFEEHLSRLESSGVDDFDAVVKAYPYFAAELTRLRVRWQRTHPAPSPDASFTVRLQKAYGDSVDPGISLEPDSTGSGSDSNLREVRLEKLASHTPETRYEVRAEIARGGMGAILKVWDGDLRRNLAMKVMLGRDEEAAKVGEPGLDPEKLSRFLEEAQITGQLEHPGIVAVHDLGIDADGRIFFTMPLVKGRDLKEIIDAIVSSESGTTEDGWTRTRVVSVFIKVCEAMAFAHSKGVIHRDIKPSNIMVGRFGETHVMDWGLAKVLGKKDKHDVRPKAPSETWSAASLVRTDRRDEATMDPDSPVVTMDGDVVGTPAYMSPEQARGQSEELGFTADIYSVGAMLYHLLAGHMPYVSAGERVSPYTVLNAVRNGPPLGLHKIDRTLPAELVAICEKAMARSAAARYRSMRDLGEDLRNFLEGRVVEAHETGKLARARKWITRNRGLAAAIGLVLLLTFGGLATVLAIEVRARQKAEAGWEEARQQQQIAVDARMKAEQETERAEQERERADSAADDAAASAREARRRSYIANVAGADLSLRLNDVRTAKQRLALADAELQGWEWRHLSLRADSSLFQARVSTRGPLAALTPGGERIVTTTLSDLHVLDADTAETIKSWRTNSLLVNDLALSPDGRLAARSARVVSSTTAPVRQLSVSLHDLETGGSHSFKVVGTEARGIRFSPDGRFLAVPVGRTGDRSPTVVLFSDFENADGPTTPTLERELPLDVETPTATAFHPSGEWLAVGTASGRILVFDAHTGEERSRVDPHSGRITSLAYSADGALLCSTSSDWTARVATSDTGEVRAVLAGHAAEVSCGVFVNGDSEIATTSADGTVRIWDATTGTAVGVLRGHEREILSLSYDATNERLLTSSSDGSLRVWDPQWSRPAFRLTGHDGPIYALAFDPSGDSLVSASSDRSILRWDLEVVAPISAHRESREPLTAMALSLDGARLAALGGGRVLRVWHEGTRRPPLELQLPGERGLSLAFHPDGETLAIGMSRGGIQLRDADTGELVRTLEGHRRRADAVVFTLDGRYLVSGSSDDSLRIWEVESGEEVARIDHHDSVTCVAIDPLGKRIAAGDAAGSVLLFDATTYELERALNGHTFGVAALAFSPDGERLLSGGRDGLVRMWDPTMGEWVLGIDLREPGTEASTGNTQVATTLVRDVAFDPTGQRIAASISRGDEQELWIWEAESSPERMRERRRSAEARARALPLVASLFGELASISDVIDRLRSDDTLEEDVREAALGVASTDTSPLEKMHAEARQIVLLPPEENPDYAHAHRLAKSAVEADDGNLEYRITLGAALHRVGLHHEAREELAVADVTTISASGVRSAVVRTSFLLLANRAQDSHGTTEALWEDLVRRTPEEASPIRTSPAILDLLREVADAYPERPPLEVLQPTDEPSDG